MKFLFDTHTFIWWDSEPSKLSPRALSLCQNQENRLLLSVASVWEMQIKLQLGKLRLKLPLAEVIDGQRQTNGVEVLSVELEHVLALEKLPAHHKDPFDRLLIAQAQVEDVVLISGDPVFARYPVNVTR
jgi:PIN domain nuclease of toxin-antitoxin system